MRKFFNVLKLTALMIVLSLLLIGASSFLRLTFINSVKIWQKNLTDTTRISCTTPQTPKISYASTTSTTTTDARYQRVISDAPLLKTTNDTDTSLSNTLFLLPKSYFVKILRNVTLDSGAEGYYVRYNTYEGYAMKSAFTGTMSDNTTSQSGIEITLQDDAGTYLRENPEITSENTKILIPASTSGIVLIGKIYGEIPSDGSSDIWYFVEYSTGPTTTYTGYVYSERCKLSTPLTDLVLDSDIKEPETTEQPLTPSLQDTSTNQTATQTPSLNTTPTLMWIIAIIFIVPIVIVFIMLIKRPRKTLDNYDLIANNDTISSSFDFDEEHSPSIIKHSSPRKFPKFRANKLDELSRFIKLDTSLETSEALDPSESQRTLQHFNKNENANDFNEHLQNNFVDKNYDQNANQTSPNEHYSSQSFRLKTPTKPVTFAKNIRISPKSTQNSTKISLFAPILDENKPKRFENANNYINSTNSSQNSTESNQKYTISNPNSTINATFDNFSDELTPLSDDFNPKSTENPKKSTNFFKNILSAKARKQKISANRKRDTFHPSVLSSDDYFEFADSFELTTPMNSHLGFDTSTHHSTNRTGKQINKRK